MQHLLLPRPYPTADEYRTLGVRNTYMIAEVALSGADVEVSSTARRQAGHGIEVAKVAASKAWSQLGLVRRFLSEAVTGGGRYVSWGNHDTCVRQMLVTPAGGDRSRAAGRPHHRPVRQRVGRRCPAPAACGGPDGGV
ncbi:zeta toxin family protein [Streptomyces sp. NPDC060232]|uniref:zeta toxin family protein n=1 Tax=Streptomyces sp. NPDC060232 TaxID=3347079 RepID=UPI0036634470